MTFSEMREMIKNNRFYTGIGILIGVGLSMLLMIGNIYANAKYQKSLDNPVQSSELEIINGENN